MGHGSALKNFQMCSVVILFLRHSFILGECMRITYSIGDRSMILWEEMLVGRKSVEKWETTVGCFYCPSQSIFILFKEPDKGNKTTNWKVDT